MKVIVTHCAHNRVVKTDMEREIERLFQENKDLRLSESHLRDELNICRQQSEVRRQIICERDKLIQELNDQITADEEELANAKASVEIQRGFREEMAEEIEALEKELAKSESDSSQGMNALVKFWEEAVNEKNKAEERAEEYHIVLMESDCRIDELEKQIVLLKNEAAIHHEEKAAFENAVNAFAETTKEMEAELARVNKERREAICKVADLESALNEARANLEAAADASSYDGELEEQLDHYKKAAIIWQEKAEAIQECREDAEARLRDVSNRFITMYQENTAKENEAREVIADLRDELNNRNARVEELEKRIEWLQNERQLYENNVARLTNERDTAVKGNAELIEENAELRDNLDAVINIKNEYAETIDEMRKKIVAAQSPEFTAHLAKLIIANLPSTDK